IRENRLNEVFGGTIKDIGIICQGGMYNAALRALQQLGLADVFGESAVSIYALNVTYPLVPEEVAEVCAGKRAGLVSAEGQPAYTEDALTAIVRRADIPTKLHGKDCLPMAGEYTGEVVLSGVAKWIDVAGESLGAEAVEAARLLAARLVAVRNRAAGLLG